MNFFSNVNFLENQLANHGYLDRSGVTNLAQGIDAINKVFGVEYDLALALNAYAVVFNGNLLDLSWSIGGPPKSKGLGALTEILLGQPSGINAHNVSIFFLEPSFQISRLTIDADKDLRG